MDVIKLDPAFPAGDLNPLPPLAPEILDGAMSPKTAFHTYFKDPKNEVSVGIWTATPYVRHLRPHVCHEFMLLVAGEVVLVGASGLETTISAPNAVVIPRGARCRWKQTVAVRKFYMTLAGDSLPSTLERPVVIDQGSLLDRIPAGADDASRAATVHYQDPSGRFLVGQWESAAFETIPIAHPKHELMHIAEGSLTLTTENRSTTTIMEGDTVFIAEGTKIAWRCDERVRKVFCSFSPTTAESHAS